MTRPLLEQAIGEHRAGRLIEAERNYRALLAETPDEPDALALLGVLLDAKGAHRDAAELIQKAIRLDPHAVLFRFHLGNVLFRLNRWNEARDAYTEALRLAPDYAEAWLTLCHLAEKNGDFALSLEAGQKAVALTPYNPSAWLNLGVVLNRLERHAEAERVYKTAIDLRPDWTESWDNLGLTYQFMNRFDEAEAAFRKVIDLAGQAIPDDDVRQIEERTFGIRHWHLAQLELMKGEYARGFGRYRCRFSTEGGLKRLDFAQPFWRGEDIAGKTILVCDEEGRGDGLMLCRYLPLLRSRGAKVKFFVRPVFTPLFRGWDGADQVIEHGEPIGDFDFYTWMFDLPYLFGTTLDSVPAQIPYLPRLAPDEDTRLAIDPRPRVGVVWAGSDKEIFDKRRIPLEIFAQLFDCQDVAFYSLTRDKRPGDDALLAQFPITDLAQGLRHFGDLARFIGQMDLIISCDTAVPQLAGGLGKKVWTLLPFSSDWRWLTNRADSPWYPTMQLFRQSTAGEWQDVIAHVKDALEDEFAAPVPHPAQTRKA